jgi:hypothetical protein
MTVFRAMGGVVLTNLSLSHAFGKNIRYTMFMGADIAEGLSGHAAPIARQNFCFLSLVTA